MIYQCRTCINYNFFNNCPNCGEAESNVPLNPEYYPEFEYKSKGIIGDILFKKKEQGRIDGKLDSILSKYKEFKDPYFINYCFLSSYRSSGDVLRVGFFNDFDLFKQVLINLGFDEINEFPKLLEKLIVSTEFEFYYKNFINETIHHLQESLESTLMSWIEEKGDLFRYELPLLLHYIYESSLFLDSVLYIKRGPYDDHSKLVPDFRNQQGVYDICEKIYLKVRVECFKKTLETFNSNQYVTIYQVDSMNGYEFESFLVELFRKKGCEVKSTPKGKDQGADLFVESFGSRIVIQAKNYLGNIGNKAVQEVIAAKQFYSCDDGMVITNRYFTPSAKELALRANIKLIDRTELQKYLDDYNFTMIESNLEGQAVRSAG